MNKLISIILILVYFWQGGYDYWIILAASIFGIAGAIEYALNKTEHIVKTKTVYESLTRDKSISEINAMLNEENKSNSDISWFKHRDG